jgi:glycosyltransferase involved in cell wall biosynthesis
MPKASIIIPCYNQGTYIDEAVDSVLNQSYEDFEIIIVNDGSTDEYTNRLLAEYRKPGTRILHTRNQGLAMARNTAISEALGNYILPLDADDRIAPGYLEKAISILEKDPDTGIVYCLGELFGARQRSIRAPEFTLRKMLLSNLIFSSAFFRKQDWEKVDGYNPNMRYGCEDWDFWLSLIELGRKVHRIPEVLFYYRVKDISMNTSMDREKRLEMHMQIMRNHKGLYIDHMRPLLQLYYGITGSWIYRLAKRMNFLSILGKML